MRILIAGGTGFIGRYLIERWLNANHTITVIGRNNNRIKKHFANQVKPLTWEQFADHAALELQHHQLVLNLTGANIGTRRWSKARKQEILDSRLAPTELLCQSCIQLADHSPPLFNASAVGIYGLQPLTDNDLPPPLDESIEINFDEYPDFLAEVGRRWEQATYPAKAHGVRVVNLRFAVVLGKKGGVLKQLGLPFKMGLGGKIGSGKQPFPWIHIEDLARAIEFLIEKTEINGPVNLIAPEAINQHQFAKAFSHALHRPCFFPLPAPLLKLIFGQMAEELLLNGQHVIPTKLQNAGFDFNYPTIEQAFEQLYS